MAYEEAKAITEAFTAGIQNDEDGWQPSAEEDLLAAAAKRDRLAATEPSWAFATVWRHDIGKPGFEFPAPNLVVLVERLIGEPVWTKKYYD